MNKNSKCEIIPITAQKGIKCFIKSQMLFYKGNKNFVPPIIAEDVKLFDKKKNPLWEHADYQLFLAKRDGEIVGRIAAIENKLHNEIHQDKVGFFGFFECINEQEVANELFDVCRKWLLVRNLDTMRGPTNPTFNDVIGFLLEGFDSPPVTLSPYTPKYYLALCEGAGFHKVKDLYAYKMFTENFRSEKLLRMFDVVKQRTNATIRELDFKNKVQLAKDVKALKHIYNSAWQPNWGFVKMTDKEFDLLVQQLIPVAEPKLTFIMQIEDKPVGFALGLPDINQALIYNRSGSMLGAVYHLLTKKKKIDSFRIIVLGVLPEYQKTGVDILLYHKFGESAKELDISYGDASWILEDNEMMNRALTSTINGQIYKKFRIYEKAIS